MATAIFAKMLEHYQEASQLIPRSRSNTCVVFIQYNYLITPSVAGI
jgi:hypothetical protein